MWRDLLGPPATDQESLSQKPDQFTKLIMSVSYNIYYVMHMSSPHGLKTQRYCCSGEIYVRQEQSFLHYKQNSILSWALQIKSYTKKGSPPKTQLTFLQLSIPKNASETFH